MSDLKQLVRDFYAKMGSGDVDGAAEMMSPDFKDNNKPPIPDFPGGREGFKMMVNMWHSAFSDMTVDPVEILVDGNMVAVRGAWSAKHTGSMMGEDPTNKVVNGHYIEILRTEGGKFVERWGYGNDAEVMGSLGMTPPG